MDFYTKHYCYRDLYTIKNLSMPEANKKSNIELLHLSKSQSNALKDSKAFSIINILKSGRKNVKNKSYFTQISMALQQSKFMAAVFFVVLEQKNTSRNFVKSNFKAK